MNLPAENGVGRPNSSTQYGVLGETNCVGQEKFVSNANIEPGLVFTK